MAFSIDYLYRIIDKYSPILDKMAQAGKKFDKTVSKIQGSLGRMEDKFKSAGAKMANLRTGLASLGAGVFLKSTINEAKQFQQALNLTKAVTQATSAQMDIMRAKALEWGASTQFSSLQISQAMAELGKMGNDVNQIIDLMPGTMALAAAGEMDMAAAANVTMATINQMGLELSDAGMVADVFAAGASSAATTVAGLASAFTNTGLQAKMSGLSVKDTTIALMGLASANMEGAAGGTMMMNALKDLEKMTSKSRKGFESMGIDIDNFRDVTTGQMTDFWGLIEAMKAANATGVQLGQIFDIRGKRAMAALVGTTSEKMDEFTVAMEESDEAAARMQETLLEGLQSFIEFESVTQNLKVIMGTFVMEALSPLLTKFNEWLGNMQKNNPETLRWITYLLMGVTVLGAVLIPLGLMISAIGSVIGAIKVIIGLTKVWSAVQIIFNAIMSANPIALIVIGIAVLIAIIILVVKYWDNIVAAVKRAWTWIGNFYEKIKGLIVLFGGPVGLGIVILIELIKKVVQNWDAISAAIVRVATAVKDFFLRAVDFIVDGVKSIINWFMKIIDNPLIATAALIFAPFFAIPAMIIKHWEPLKEFFAGVLDKITGVVSAVAGFTGGVIDFIFGNEPLGQPPASRANMTEAPIPQGYGRNARATANATVSVYTEKGMTAVPFKPSGDLGYNMSDTYSRGM